MRRFGNEAINAFTDIRAKTAHLNELRKTANCVRVAALCSTNITCVGVTTFLHSRQSSLILEQLDFNQAARNHEVTDGINRVLTI